MLIAIMTSVIVIMMEKMTTNIVDSDDVDVVYNDIGDNDDDDVVVVYNE